jgi:hypothetical protein
VFRRLSHVLQFLSVEQVRDLLTPTYPEIATATLCVVFSPRQADEVRHALRIVERFVALNCELFQLVEAIQEWEKRYEGSCIDRGEPSLRAA